MKALTLNLILVVMLLLGSTPLMASSTPPVGSNVVTSSAGSTAPGPVHVQEVNASVAPAAKLWEKLPPEVQAKVDPRILAELRGEVVPAHLGSNPNQAEVVPAKGEPLEKTRFLVHLKAKADLETIAQQTFATRTEQRTAVFNALVHTALATQGPVKALLDARISRGNVTSYQPFYIFNGFAVEGDLDTIVELAQRGDVERIVANYPLVPLWKSGNAVSAPSSDLGGLNPDNWNIDLVDAERVWKELGITGQGAVVGDFDTGVDWTHPALQTRYRGYSAAGSNHNYNWFEADPYLYPDGNLGPSASSVPYDCGGHGTHTMGTMVGDGGTPGTQVGMAPGAKWIAAPGICGTTMPGSIGDDIGGVKTFQWFLCPTDLSGDLATADCSRAPDVINNSWGSANPADDTLRPAIQALRAAGIAPVFASGNPSAGPGSIGSPASNPEAITVGATDINDSVASFSGRGPSFYEGEQKPELSAPGVDVNSTVPGGGYSGPTWSGTSMAAPHVAGLVALMVSADLQDGYRDFNVDELERFMEYTAVDLGAPGPDDDYGYGRIDAYNAVRWVRSAGDLQGTVRNASTHVPIEGASVAGLKASSGDMFATWTAASGQYSTTVPAGVYDVTVEAWGHVSKTFASQTVITGALSVADFSLSAMPTAVLTGKVLRGTTPVSGALIYVAARPTVNFTTGADGAYTLGLPVGTHELVVEAAGYRVLREDVSVASGGAAHNFSMTSAPRILLVDADTYAGWFFGWPVRSFFRWSLDQENYLYDLWPVQYTWFNDTQDMPDGSIGYGIPSPATLNTYDLVIWAHGGGNWWPTGSTVGMGADDELMAYLDGGGRLIISGQDLGYHDDGTTFYDDYLHADYAMDAAAGEGETVSGQGFLAGLNLEITNASLHGYANGATGLWPDAAVSEDGAAFPVLTYDNGNGMAALAVDPCDATYRAVYFALGYENMAPRAGKRDPAIAEVLDRSMTWVMASQPTYGVSVVAMPLRQMGQLGDTANYDLQVINTGTQAATFQLGVSGNAWPTRIFSGTTVVTQPLAIAPCNLQELTLEVDVPATASAGDADTAIITASRHPAGTPAQSVTVTTVAFPQWQIETPMPTPRYRLGAAALPGDVHYYAIGGWDSFGTSATNERYNACTGQWSVMTPMPRALANVGVAALGGKIYVVGGYTSLGTFYDAVYVYDLATDTWSSAAELPQALAGGAVASASGKLYVFGGNNEGGFLDNTYEYNPMTDTWTEKAPMPGGGRTYAVAAGLDGRIYVVGGWPNLATVEVYEPATDSWSTAAPLHVGRQSPGLTAAPDGHLYVSGGGNGWDGLASAERYNPATNTWEIISSLNDSNRAGSASAYVAGRVFAVGGVYLDLSGVNESLHLTDAFCLSDKSAWQSVVRPGDRITYTVEIRSDAVALTNARLVDPIPVGTAFAGFGINPIGATYNSTNKRVEWNGPIPAGVAPLTFTFGVNATASGRVSGDPITNAVTFDSGTGLVFTRTAVSLLDFPDASPSTKQVNATTALAGDVLTYTIHVENGSAISDVFTLRDPIPANATYVPGSLIYDTGTGSYDSVARAIVWNGTLPGTDVYANTSGDYEWGDSNGGGAVPGVTYDWIEISGTGTPVVFASNDDDYFYPIALPFTFNFYGTGYTNLAVATNGAVYFEDNYLGLSNTPIPSDSGYGVNTFIAPLWDDLYVSPGAVYYEVRGSAPDRRLVIEYYQVSGCCLSPDDVTWEVVLYENGAILMQYQDVTTGNSRDYGAEATVGIQNSSTQGLQYSYNVPALSDGLAIVFLPDEASWMVMTPYADVVFAVATATSLPVNTWITNTATITGPYGPVRRSAGTVINPVELSASVKEVNKAQAVVGEVVRYDFVLKNTGLLTAVGATLTDTIPSATSYVPGSVSCSSGSCGYASGMVTWTGDIVPGDQVILTFAVTLTTPLPDRTPVTNVASLNNGYRTLYSLEAVFLARSSDLATSFKQVDPVQVEPGGTVTYTVYVHNSGGGNVVSQMRDVLPPGLTYKSGSLVCGTGSCSYASGVIIWTGTIASRSMVPVRFQATALTGLAYSALITNTAVVTDVVWGAGYPVQATLTVVRHYIYLPLVMRNY